MKRLLFLLPFALLLIACGGPEGQEVESGEALDEATPTTAPSATYMVDASASMINWEGTKPTGSHVGIVPVSDGKLMVADGKLVSGQFTIDLTKIENTDLPEEKKGDLVGHLKGEDFFHVEEFPSAEFTIVKVQPVTNSDEGITHELTGNLMMRGQERSITIPATVTMDGDEFKASTPKFTIDRTEWGVNYGSNSALGVIKDKAISDELGLEIMLLAKKG